MSKADSRIFRRFLSEQGYRNGAFLSEESETKKIILSEIKESFPVPIRDDQQSNKTSLWQQTLQIAQKSEKPMNSFATLNLVYENEHDIMDSNKSKHSAVDMGQTSHRNTKTGYQRWRWNLLFNVLVWLIVPLPIWMPFVSNMVACYLLISIQGIFVFIWTGMSKISRLCLLSLKQNL